MTDCHFCGRLFDQDEDDADYGRGRDICNNCRKAPRPIYSSQSVISPIVAIAICSACGAGLVAGLLWLLGGGL